MGMALTANKTLHLPTSCYRSSAVLRQQFLDSISKVDGKSPEDKQTDDLNGQTGHHEIDTVVLATLTVGGIGYSSSDRLEHKGEHIEADEYDYVVARTESVEGEGGIIEGKTAHERDVDGCGEEYRCDCETNNISERVSPASDTLLPL